jgi:hypothetical protein
MGREEDRAAARASASLRAVAVPHLADAAARRGRGVGRAGGGARASLFSPLVRDDISAAAVSARVSSARTR